MAGDLVIRIIGINDGTPTDYDGQWVVEYDPTRAGVSPSGQPMTAHLVATADRSRARRFNDAAALYALVRATTGRLRPDGRPDQPMTAFHLAIEPFSEDRP